MSRTTMDYSQIGTLEHEEQSRVSPQGPPLRLDGFKILPPLVEPEPDTRTPWQIIEAMVAQKSPADIGDDLRAFRIVSPEGDVVDYARSKHIARKKKGQGHIVQTWSASTRTWNYTHVPDPTSTATIHVHVDPESMKKIDHQLLVLKNRFLRREVRTYPATRSAWVRNTFARHLDRELPHRDTPEGILSIHVAVPDETREYIQESAKRLGVPLRTWCVDSIQEGLNEATQESIRYAIALFETRACITQEDLEQLLGTPTAGWTEAHLDLLRPLSWTLIEDFQGQAKKAKTWMRVQIEEAIAARLRVEPPGSEPPPPEPAP